MGTGVRSGSDVLVEQTAAAAVTALFLVAFEWAITRLFALNFSVAGPNATLALSLLFVTGWILPVVALFGERWRTLSTAAACVGAAAFAASLFLPLRGALVAALVAMLAVTPLAAALVDRLGHRFALGAAVGVVLVQLVRAAGNTVAPYGFLAGKAAMVVVALALVAAWIALGHRDTLPAVSALGAPVDAFAAFVLAEVVYLLSATTVARWTLRPSFLVAVASALGVLAGGAVVAVASPRVRDSPAWIAVFAFAVVDLLWLDLAMGGTVFLAQAGAVVVLAQACRARRGSALWAGASMSAAQFAGLLVALLYTSAVNAPYMPGPLSALGGLETPLLFAATLLVPALAALAWLTVGRIPERRSGVALESADRRTLLGLAAGAVGTVTGAGFWAFQSGPSGGKTAELRAMTYNVHRFLSATDDGAVSLDAIASVIREQDPQLVGLQETEGSRVTTGAFDGVGWLADELGYHAVDLTPGEMDTYGVALLSKWPITNERLFRLPVGNSPPRLALLAQVERPQGRLPVIVTHFETGSPADAPPDKRAEQADHVVNLAVEFDRAVVLGDFNTEPGEGPYERLAATLTDAWPEARPATPGYTWSASNPQRRIDHVWLRGDWTVTDATVSGGPAASDHRAVTATLQEE